MQRTVISSRRRSIFDIAFPVDVVSRKYFHFFVMGRFRGLCRRGGSFCVHNMHLSFWMQTNWLVREQIVTRDNLRPLGLKSLWWYRFSLSLLAGPSATPPFWCQPLTGTKSSVLSSCAFSSNWFDWSLVGCSPASLWSRYSENKWSAKAWELFAFTRARICEQCHECLFPKTSKQPHTYEHDGARSCNSLKDP